ncbi:phage holin family protein [Acidipropionibacterium jensenii]|uniref:Phage holin family protein n=1 Tax=Acidipropionibacterium jensenii TaxID=1749 RepID=A0A3Q9UJ02_9ACTN|nr:phage holin family protein [Acidipropionibacterium jensenii]AZZ38663.1 phage holin family protein [Acidipropionibacterium jensenii]AZZ43161.1 phage holin family protein [Acidipropionibacterium jensenii]MDN5976356.1 phage holin family protein [Acidipropionibacterium jensenii]MDN5995617.1 phage holin family protein [Acidipropionibacterium jensenii]MDN6426536.1 phage holin family protein [Acidipropionibacterium jensenii]
MADMSQLGDIIATLKSDGQSLVKDNIALAKAEIKPAAIHAGVGGGLFGGAGYLAINAATLFFLAGGFALSLWAEHLWDWSLLLSLVVGFGVLGVILLVLAGILALVGKWQVGKVEAPKATVAEAKQTVLSLKSSFQHGMRKAGVSAKQGQSDKQIG